MSDATPIAVPTIPAFPEPLFLPVFGSINEEKEFTESYIIYFPCKPNIGFEEFCIANPV